jgi:hypothetical protein
MKRRWIAKGAGMLVLGIVGAAVFGFAVMLLWNALVPDLFHGPVLTFWQAVGLLVLSHIFLGGKGGWHHRHGWRHDRWRRKFEEKLASMTPEEREKFNEEWRHRCGPGWKEHENKPSEAKA